MDTPRVWNIKFAKYRKQAEEQILKDTQLRRERRASIDNMEPIEEKIKVVLVKGKNDETRND